MITDEQLLFFALGDGLTDDERAVIEQALTRDDLLQARLCALQADLATLQAQPTIERPLTTRAPRRLGAPLMTLAALLVVGLLGTVMVQRAARHDAQLADAAAWNRALVEHLQILQQLLGTLPADDAAARHALLTDAIQRNDAQRGAAARRGDAAELRALTSFGLQLQELAEGDATERREQLQFELAATQTRLQAHPSNIRAAR
jgi:hypothetical protein